MLDAIEVLAEKQRKSIGIVFDEFQEIHQFGGEKAEWHLRGVIQRHHHVGPIDPAHMARWINTRMHSRHVATNAVGARIVRIAGPRTRDIVRLARVCFDIAASVGAVRDSDVDAALQRITDDAAPQYLAMWDTLTRLQQPLLRPLLRKDLISKAGSQFTFDDPYFRAWVVTNALPDLGIVRRPWA